MLLFRIIGVIVIAALCYSSIPTDLSAAQPDPSSALRPVAVREKKSPWQVRELIQTSHTLTARLLSDFGITDTQHFTMLYANVYYFVYYMQRIIGEPLTEEDYQFLLDMLALEEKAVEMGKRHDEISQGTIFNAEREIYINLTSELARQIRVWMKKGGFQTKAELDFYKVFGRPTTEGLIENFIYRIYYHLTHQYTDRQHFDNIMLATREFKQLLEEAQATYGEQFVRTPLAESLYLYGSIRHSLGIGDLDAGFYNPDFVMTPKRVPRWRLFDSEIVDMYIWPKDPDQTAVHFPAELRIRSDLEFIYFIYGIRAIQRLLMQEGLYASARQIGEVAEKVWVKEQKVTAADIAGKFDLPLLSARTLAVRINAISLDQQLSAILGEPPARYIAEHIGQLETIREWRRNFREYDNLSPGARRWLTDRKERAMDLLTHSPFLELEEIKYLRHMTTGDI